MLKQGYSGMGVHASKRDAKRHRRQRKKEERELLKYYDIKERESEV